jgi:K+-transporting ATPase ATPase C chain
LKLLLQSVLQTILWTILVGVLYPLAMTFACQALFPSQANGSLILGKDKDGKAVIVGSALIAQQFSSPKYFWPRPSATSPPYSTMPSGASNYGPTSKALHDNVLNNAGSLRKANDRPADTPVPSDLVFTSASGVDPDISPKAARFQINRVAAARGLKPEDVSALVDQHVEQPQWGVFGEARVNVLELNLALDQKFSAKNP